ncbi:hypothetical protein PG984_005612 [Apiospora sp. TS-2023a]
MAEIPAVARYCDNAKGNALLPCLLIPPTGVFWFLGIGLLLYFLPDLIWWAQDAIILVYLAYHGRRRRRRRGSDL